MSESSNSMNKLFSWGRPVVRLAKLITVSPVIVTVCVCAIVVLVTSKICSSIGLALYRTSTRVHNWAVS